MSSTEGSAFGVVLAAGSGARFGAAKQFEQVGTVRAVDLAVEATRRACGRVAVVLPPGTAWDGPDVDLVVAGGATRPESVQHAVDALPGDVAIVVLHQAANPMASPDSFAAVLRAVRAGADAAVPGVVPPDVVGRVVDGSLIEVVGRDDLVLVQTPGAFRIDVLRAALASDGSAIEETSRVLAVGGRVKVVPGDPANVHVVRPADLALLTRPEPRGGVAG